jgi:hypothetical protein
MYKIWELYKVKRSPYCGAARAVTLHITIERHVCTESCDLDEIRRQKEGGKGEDGREI